MMPRPDQAKQEQRVQAVLALFRGEAVADVSMEHQIGRSALYKFRRRALAAIEQALAIDAQGRGDLTIASPPTAKRRWSLFANVILRGVPTLCIGAAERKRQVRAQSNGYARVMVWCAFPNASLRLRRAGV